jgi:phosphoribosyl-ATP pyrophosphohydrolase/phosphoribosyl-AMP cyclohydrolase
MVKAELNPNYAKYADGLIPAIIQDHFTSAVLMLGFMNQDALNQTLKSGRVCFFSRTKNRLWSKGEESGNFLEVVDIKADCDNDTLLIKAIPNGPTCHTGQDTCFGELNTTPFLPTLESIIKERKKSGSPTSYVSGLFNKGLNSIAQKVGEEAVEMILEAKDNDDQKFLDESADLLFHYLLLLNAKGKKLQDVEEVLKKRHRNKKD